MARSKHLIARVKLRDQFHAYVLGSVIGIRWGKITPTSGMGNSDLGKIVREYLAFACDEEWDKLDVLNAMRDKSGATIKADARKAFPSLFPKNKRALALQVPKELEGIEVSFDPELIDNWRGRAKAIKKEILMNENAAASETQETGAVDRRPPIDRKARRSKVNFVVPKGVDPSTMTLDNYRELTGARFRMTKDQKDVRGMTRAEAFEEAKALALSQLSKPGEVE